MEEVINRFHTYFVANDPATGGSLYLQSKIFNAKDALLAELDVDPDSHKVDASGQVIEDSDSSEDSEEDSEASNKA